MKLSESKELNFECIASNIIKKDIADNSNIYNIVASIDVNSIEKLKNIFSNEEVKNSKAFSYYVGELSNAGIVNRNGHACSVEDTVRIYKKFENTFIDLDHNRSNIVGFVVKANLTDPETKDILTEEEALNKKSPINISIGFIVWPSADVSFYSILEKTSSSKEGCFGLISLSWEVAFNEFNVLKGAKNQFDGEIITEDSEIEKIESFLTDFGGMGKLEDGTEVYMLPTGENLTPLGVGLVINPAAYVDPILSVSASLDNEIEDNLSIDVYTANNLVEKINLIEQKQIELNDNLKQLELKSSQSIKEIVTKNRMKIKNIQDITDESLKEVQASEVVSFIADEIAKKSEEHKAEIEAKENEVADIKAKSEQAEAKVNELTDSVAALTKELEDLKAAAAAEKANNDFQFRMNSLAEEFELSDEDNQVIASQIRDLSEEDYANWKASFDVLAKEKNKEVIKEKCKKEVKASVDTEKQTEVTKDPIEELKAKAELIPNSSTFSSDVLSEYKNAFSLEKGVTIEL